MVAVLRKETGIAFGNVVGSNLFNMLSIGGITAVIRPLPVPLHMRALRFSGDDGHHGACLFVRSARFPTNSTAGKALSSFVIYGAYIVTLFAVNGTFA